MDKYSIFILGNNNNTNVEFVEKPYKLNAGETLVGKDNDFPEKKSLAGMFDIEPFFNGWKSTSGNFTITEGGIGGTPSHQIQLAEIIDDLFPVVSGENFPDRYITGELELFFATNHWFYDSSGEEVIATQVSATANKLYRFSCLKNFATGGYNNLNYSIATTGLSAIHESGRYTIYTGVDGVHKTVSSIGLLPDTAFTSEIQITTPTNIGIVVQAFLKSSGLFMSTPAYETAVHWKLRLFNHEVLDYTFERKK